VKNLISALSKPKENQMFIPYRESQLTRYLMEFIGNNALVDVLFTISLNSTSLEQTKTTLKIARKCRKIS